MTVSIQFFKDYPEPTIYKNITRIDKFDTHVVLEWKKTCPAVVVYPTIFEETDLDCILRDVVGIDMRVSLNIDNISSVWVES